MSEKRVIRLVQLIDIEDDTSIMLLNTDMTDSEIEAAVTDESLDELSYDYEEKLDYHAERKKLHMARVYVEEVRV